MMKAFVLTRCISVYGLSSLSIGLFLLLSADTEDSRAADPAAKSTRSFSYKNEQIPEGPWSIQVVKVERGNPEFQLHTTLPRGNSFGLATLSDQIRALPSQIGRPLAGLNGDFYKRRQPYLGDPKGLQITRGELVSAPCDWTCIWIDAEGIPHMTNVLSQFEVTWPNGRKIPFGLNEDRPRDGAVLYTAVAGATTQTSGGRELILERNGTNDWLPLRAGMTYTARVRTVRETGNSPIAKGTVVLSLARPLAKQVPAVGPGAVIQISTATTPDLKGAVTAIGGGPAIIRNGTVIERSDARVRHPRSAVGWSKDHYFLVQVDGRQRGLSVGMTMPELADYLLKLGCTEAMNLDGGGSSTFWAYGQIMNNPSEGAERGMGNALVIVQKEKP